MKEQNIVGLSKEICLSPKFGLRKGEGVVLGGRGKVEAKPCKEEQYECFWEQEIQVMRVVLA